MYHQKLTLRFGDTIELRYCLLRQGDFTMKGAYHRITERITRVRLGDASFSLLNRITKRGWVMQFFRYQGVSPNDRESVMTNIVIVFYHQTDSGAICWLSCFLGDLFLLTLFAFKTYHLHGVQIFQYNMHIFFKKSRKRHFPCLQKPMIR